MHAAVAAESSASKRHAIDANVRGTLTRFHETVKGSKELVSKASGVLAFPSVIKVGFIAGGEYGEAALHVSGKTVGYYGTVSGSFGLPRARSRRSSCSCSWRTMRSTTFATPEAGRRGAKLRLRC